MLRRPTLPVLTSCLVVLFVASLTANWVRADTPAGVASGYFEGELTSPQAGKLGIALNLTAAGGKYEGVMVTPLGSFDIRNAAVTGKRLHLELVTGTAFDFEVTVDTLRGTFRSGDETGPVELKRTGDARPANFNVPKLNLTKQQWREDLRFYVRELKAKHVSLYHFLPREKFELEVAKLEGDIDRLDGDEIFVRFVHLASAVGDGHTHFEAPEDSPRFPIEVRGFGEEYRVVGTGPEQRAALGARIVRVGQAPFTKVRRGLLELTPQDENPSLGPARIEPMLVSGLYLHGAGFLANRERGVYTLLDDQGKEFTIDLPAVPANKLSAKNRVYVFPRPPLYRTHAGESFWSTYFPDSRSVYCGFRGYDNLSIKAGEMLKLVSEHRPDKLIVDLRQNGGGDYFEGEKYVIEPIRRLAEINRAGHLFVLIGPTTFSAGMSNAAGFRQKTAALLVGEPIGEKPNSFQEAREMRLPNSRLIARYSTTYYEFQKSGPNEIRPDHRVDRTWEAYKAGRDPVLEWTLDYKDK